MKVSKVFFETILPIIVVTSLFMSFIYAKEKLSSEEQLPLCERYELSTVVYIIFGLAIILISSIYQIVIGNWILKKKANKYFLNTINSFLLGGIFTSIHIGMELFNRKPIDAKFCIVLFTIMFLLGLWYSLLKIIAKRITRTFAK